MLETYFLNHSLPTNQFIDSDVGICSRVAAGAYQQPVQTATTVKPIKTTTGPVKKYCEFTFRNSQSADEVVRLINNKSRLSSIFCYRYNTIVIPNI